MTKYRTIIALHAWKWVNQVEGDQTYCEPDDPHLVGWNVHLQHRDPVTDDLVEPEKAPDLDLDTEDYATAYLVADALAVRNGWELREY